MSSGSVQITIAVIGVIGSVAVAYITTGAAFESKLKADAASIAELRDSIRAVSTQLSGEVRDAQERIARLVAKLDSAYFGVDSLTKQVSKVGAQVQRLHLNPAVFEQLNKKPAH
jgi:peptidoglycan hydrolase CwlO-like protein